MAGLDEFPFSPLQLVCVCTIIAILCFFAVVGNVALLYAIFSQARLRTTSNMFIASLACSNLLCGSWTMPVGFIALTQKHWIFGDGLCQFSGFVDNITISSGMLILGLTSIDRYFLVCHAVKYADIVTRRRCRASIATIWIWSILVASPPLVGWNAYSFSSNSYTCASGMGGEGLHKYYFLFYVIATFPLPIMIIFPTYFCILQGSIRPAGQGLAKRHRSNLRTAKIILLLIILFMICVFPVFIMGLMYWSGVQFGQLPRLTGFIVVWLVISNSAINPIIYGLLNNNFRAVYVAMIKKWCRRSASSFRKQAKNVSTVSTGGNVSQNVSNVNNTQASTLEEQDLMNSKKDEEHKT